MKRFIICLIFTLFIISIGCNVIALSKLESCQQELAAAKVAADDNTDCINTWAAGKADANLKEFVILSDWLEAHPDSDLLTNEQYKDWSTLDQIGWLLNGKVYYIAPSQQEQ